MEVLLSYLPIIYCFWTGILIAGGLVTMYGFANNILTVRHLKRKTRCSDVAQLVVVSGMTVGLFTLLFIIPQFAAFHMDTILFFEIWYSMFLYNATETSMLSVAPLKKLKENKMHSAH